jgi:2-methylcitrate dehydratase PrpD
VHLVGRPDIPDPDANYARLCLPFVAATALLRGTVGLSDFYPHRLIDPEVHALASKVDVDLVDNPDENALGPQMVRISLKDGSNEEVVVEHAPGHPDNPLSRDQQLDKFHECWRSAAMTLGIEASKHIIKNVERLEDVADVRTLVQFLVPEKARHAPGGASRQGRC